MDSELFGKLFTMQKLNILIYWLNKLHNANMGFLLSLKTGGEIFRHVEVQHAFGKYIKNL